MRRPARLERTGALTPRDRIWAAIRSFGRLQRFSVIEVTFLSEQRADTVISYLRALEHAQFVGRFPDPRPNMGPPRRELGWWQLVRDIGVEAPRINKDGEQVTQGTGREQMWLGMRKFKGTFDWRDLIAVCAVQVSMYEAKDYLKHLQRAGYLRVAAQKRALGQGKGAAPAKYEFVKSRDTGPRAPLITRDKSVIDANTGTTMLTTQGKNNDKYGKHEQGAGVT